METTYCAAVGDADVAQAAASLQFAARSADDATRGSRRWPPAGRALPVQPDADSLMPLDGTRGHAVPGQRDQDAARARVLAQFLADYKRYRRPGSRPRLPTTAGSPSVGPARGTRQLTCLTA